MQDSMTQDEDAERLRAIAWNFAYQRVVNGCRFADAAEMRATNKAWAQIYERKLAEAFNEAMHREASSAPTSPRL